MITGEDMVMDIEKILIWVWFSGVQIADVLSTRAFLRLGVREGNPVIARIMDLAGGAWWQIKLAMTLGAAAVLHWLGHDWMIFVLGGLTGLAALRNLRIIRSTSRGERK